MYRSGHHLPRCHLTLTKPGGRRGDPTMPLTAPYADAASIESVD